MTPAQRAFAISEWRGLPEPPPRPDRLVSVGQCLVGLVKSLGLEERIREEAILGAWKDIVGDFIAQHSKPSSLQKGVLFVQVLQPTMHYELDRVWKVKILQKLKEQFGARAVTEIRFRIG